MDRILEKKKGLQKKHIPYVAGGAALLILLGWLILGDHSSSLKVDSRTVTIEKAQRGQFNDYVRVNGNVLPITTVQISPLESGNVDVKVVEEGAMVKKGDIIVKLTNPQLNMQILTSEADLAYQENQLRDTRVSMEQEKLNLRQERLQVEMNVARTKRRYEQYAALEKENLISHEEYLQAKEDYELAARQKELIYDRQVQDSIFRSLQIDNMEISLESMKKNMELIRQRVDNLNVRANIDGELGQLDVVLGQYVTAGTKVGQINDLSDYKIEAMIDEHYIDRVKAGLEGTFERQGKKFGLVVKTVFPEVRDGQFRTWCYLTGERPDNIRAGQTYYINLELGQPTDAIIIPRGAFYQTTGGSWIFVVSPDGKKAFRRSVKIGRQNPQYYEVLEGLDDGERVIVSSYETFGDNEVLILK
ncbi:MAG TPA: efflux RND transporter periplasmic adaptor subunit [Candidatus Rikenella faecigallinarum]|uniref:Efflux RND transporter periplasmic adaptor subunit n=1 Tax=Candidatus Rikenella faecigallinarum TaxID=2838745 RepID=A0A9D1TXA5_9BACT|nr:efflux RND transporter periplasmic adaptor subunit [Candidatus Rikenella faecigallinarum]